MLVATGARPYRPSIERGEEEAHVVDAWSVILETEAPTSAAVSSSPTGVATGSAWASPRSFCPLPAATCGSRSTATTGHQTIQQYVRDASIAALNRAHVTILPLTRPFGYDGSAVFLQHTLTEEAVIVEDVAALVLAHGHLPELALLDALAARTDLRSAAGHPIEIHGIGDCLAPRTVEEAVLEGLRVASAI